MIATKKNTVFYTDIFRLMSSSLFYLLDPLHNNGLVDKNVG